MSMSCKHRFSSFVFISLSNDRPRLLRGDKEMYLKHNHSFGQPTRLINKSTISINGNVFEIDNCNRLPDGAE